MTPKEQRWHKARCGKVTSSALDKLLTKGKKDKVTKIQKQWGDVSIGYLYEKLYELEFNKPVRNEDNKNFRWGHEQEPMAIAWLRENTMYEIVHCSEDLEDIRFTNGGIEDFGDSLDFLADGDILGEIKCVTSQAKFAKIKRSTKADVVDEYREQLAGHFAGNPESDVLLYVVYDGRGEDDEMDEIDEMDPRRGVIFEFYREEFEGLIEIIKDRIKEGMAAVRQSLETGEKLESILNG